MSFAKILKESLVQEEKEAQQWIVYIDKDPETKKYREMKRKFEKKNKALAMASAMNADDFDSPQGGEDGWNVKLAKEEVKESEVVDLSKEMGRTPELKEDVGMDSNLSTAVFDYIASKFMDMPDEKVDVLTDQIMKLINEKLYLLTASDEEVSAYQNTDHYGPNGYEG